MELILVFMYVSLDRHIDFFTLYRSKSSECVYVCRRRDTTTQAVASV